MAVKAGSRRYIWVTLAVTAVFTAATSLVTVYFVRGGPWDGPPPELTWSIAESFDDAPEARWADIACPAKDDCWVVGSGVPLGGAAPALLGHIKDGRWQRVIAQGQPDVGGDLALHAVACRSATDCWAIGEIANPSLAGVESGALLLHYGGSEWLPDEALSEPRAHLTDIDCAASGCVVVGYTLDGRSLTPRPLVARQRSGTWSLIAGPAIGGQLSSVSCPVQDQCFATGHGGDGGLLIAAGNDAWRAVSPAGRAEAALARASDPRIACPATTRCLILGAASGELLGVDGDDWTAEPPGTRGAPPNGAQEAWHGFDCFTERFCWAAGTRQTAGRSTLAFFDGQRWLAQELPDSGEVVLAIACTLPTDCWAVGIDNGHLLVLRGRG